MIKSVNSLSLLFNKMESCGKVKPYLRESIGIIDTLNNKLELIKKRKLNIEDYGGAFKFHHIVVVSTIVLKSMRNRLSNSEIQKDNPQAAMDSMRILPDLRVALEMVNSNVPQEDFVEFASELQINAKRLKLFNLELLKTKIISKENLSEIAKEINLSCKYG